MLSIILASALIFGGGSTSLAVAIPFKQYKLTVSHTTTNYKTTIRVFASTPSSASSMAALNGWQVISLEEVPVVGNLEDTTDTLQFNIAIPEPAYSSYSTIMPAIDGTTSNDNTNPALTDTTPLNSMANRNGDNNTPTMTLVAEIHFMPNSLDYENTAELNILPLLIKGNVQYFVAGYGEVGFIEGAPDSNTHLTPSMVDTLSTQRANKVAAYLKSKGAKDNQITVVGFGSALPAYTDTYYKPKGNRRVEVYTYE